MPATWAVVVRVVEVGLPPRSVLVHQSARALARELARVVARPPVPSMRRALVQLLPPAPLQVQDPALVRALLRVLVPALARERAQALPALGTLGLWPSSKAGLHWARRLGSQWTPTWQNPDPPLPPGEPERAALVLAASGQSERAAEAVAMAQSPAMASQPGAEAAPRLQRLERASTSQMQGPQVAQTRASVLVAGVA